MAEYTAFIDRLIDKTRNGKISWKPAAGKTFIAALEGEFTFEVDFSDEHEIYAFSMSDRDGVTIVELTAQDTSPYSSERRDDDEYYSQLKTLYQAARWVGLGIEKKLSDAQALLDKF